MLCAGRAAIALRQAGSEAMIRGGINIAPFVRGAHRSLSEAPGR